MEKTMQDMDRNIKHCVAESTALGGTNWAEHIYSVRMQEDCDNGVLCTLGEYVKDEVYAAADYKAGASETILILNPPLLPFNNLQSYAQETAYYNGEGEDVRGYVLKVGDRYTLTDVIFEGTPEIGKYVTFDAVSKKYVPAAQVATDKFCAKVLSRVPSKNAVKYKLRVEAL